MLIFEPLRAEITERAVPSASIEDLIDEARGAGGRDILEGFIGDRIDGLDLEGFHEALSPGAIIGIATSYHRSDETMFGQSLPIGAGSILQSAIAVMDSTWWLTSLLNDRAQGGGGVSLTSIERPMA